MLGNISLPLTCNFIGEFLILYSLFKILSIVSITAISLSIFIGTSYTMIFFNKIAYGIEMELQKSETDLNLNEFIILLPIIFLLFVIGIYPQIIFELLNSFMLNLKIDKLESLCFVF